MLNLSSEIRLLYRHVETETQTATNILLTSLCNSLVENIILAVFQLQVFVLIFEVEKHINSTSAANDVTRANASAPTESELWQLSSKMLEVCPLGLLWHHQYIKSRGSPVQ